MARPQISIKLDLDGKEHDVFITQSDEARLEQILQTSWKKLLGDENEPIPMRSCFAIAWMAARRAKLPVPTDDTMAALDQFIAEDPDILSMEFNAEGKVSGQDPEPGE
jgi:hypothetical protein